MTRAARAARTSRPARAPRAWYAHLFEGLWHRFDSAGHEDTEVEARAVAALLGLPRGARVLDVPCGWGRVALSLARDGYAVTGVDLSPRLVREAQRAAARSGLPVRIVRGDMRRLTFRGTFDAALSLYSSFGFFATRADDVRVLAGMARAVRPGGAVLIEGLARDWLAAHWSSHWWTEREGIRILERRAFDHRSSCMHSVWEFQRVDARGRARTAETHALTLRVYTPHELADLAADAGLRHVQLLGSYDGDPYAFDSRRLILIARRPTLRARVRPPAP